MELQSKLKRIKIFLTDVDGVMNDGRIYYLPTGDGVEVAKFFNVKDGLGIKLLKLAGIKFGIITGRADKVVYKRCLDLGCDYIEMGVGDKAEVVKNIINKENISKEEICYIGDDWNDVPVFELVGLSMTVADAPEEIKKKVDFVIPKRGGEGVIRYIVDELLKSKGIYEEIIDKFLENLKSA
jgi:3-deoxy-D-manno-octulosonate 8-phosphate phosphatase (KDO 8-P phosphatase)